MSKNKDSKLSVFSAPGESKSRRANEVDVSKPRGEVGLAHSETSPYFVTLNKVSQNDRRDAERFVGRYVEKAGIIGLLDHRLQSSKTSAVDYTPVLILKGYSEPVLMRRLDQKKSKKDLKRMLKIQSFAFPLEVSDLIEDHDGSLVLRRTFVPLTLQDVINSNSTVSLTKVLDSIVKLFFHTERLHLREYTHGHIHPGNVGFQGSTDGCLVDIGVSFYSLSSEADLDNTFAPEFRIKRENNDADQSLDLYGLGFTLKKLLKGILLDHNHKDISMETLHSSLSPLIAALMHKDAKKRPEARLARSMLLDLLPMVVPNYSAPDLRDSGELWEVDERDFDSLVDALEKVEATDLHSGDLVTNDDFFSFEAHEKSDSNHVDLYREDEQFSAVLGLNNNSIMHTEDLNIKKHSSGSSARKIQNFILILMILITSLLVYKLKDRFDLSLFTQQSDSYEVSGEYQGPYLGLEDLAASWNSQVPSRMEIVAQQAVQISPMRGLAEQVILTSLRQNEISNKLVDTGLLRVAFHDQWEVQLDEVDRRYALSLGLIDLIGNMLPPGLGLIEDRHPALLLAILSAGNNNVKNVLKNVPASLLGTLPSPYGTSFQILEAGRGDISCVEEDVIQLARFSTRGIEKPLELTQFLQEEFSRRISSLSVAYSHNNEHARKLLDIIIAHPNLALSTPEVLWAKKVDLMAWSDVEYVDQLFLLAGVPLRKEKKLDAPTIAKLFLNPSPRIRSYAAGLAVDAIRFKHPAATKLLGAIQAAPELLTGEQLVMLGQILEDPEKTIDIHRRVVHSFISSKPPVDIAKMLLLSTATSKSGSALDGALSVYLTEKDWSPDAGELLKLSTHPDRVTRMFAYQKIFQFEDKGNAKLLLKEALSKEVVPEFKEQLESLIKTLQSP